TRCMYDMDQQFFVVDGGVLRQDRDAALALEVGVVHHAIGDLLVGAEGAALAQQAIDERGFAMINVRDDRDIASKLVSDLCCLAVRRPLPSITSRSLFGAIPRVRMDPCLCLSMRARNAITSSSCWCVEATRRSARPATAKSFSVVSRCLPPTRTGTRAARHPLRWVRVERAATRAARDRVRLTNKPIYDCRRA